MNTWETLAVAFGVSLDAFAIALAIGLASPRMTWKKTGQFAAALIIPSMGMAIGSHTAASYCLPHHWCLEHWSTPLALGWIGTAMIFGQHREPMTAGIPTSWRSVIVLGLIASLDVGFAGVAMGIEEGTSTAAVCVVPALTVLFVLTGLLLGSRLSDRTGRYAEITGGSLLIGIAQYCCFS